MSKVEMVAVRQFPRAFGQAIRRLAEGETFWADEKEVDALEETGKAVRKKAEKKESPQRASDRDKEEK